MRKFLAVLSGLVMAVLAVGGIMAWRGMDVSLNGIVDLIKIKPKIAAATPALPSVPSEALPLEPDNLSYDELMQKGDYYYERGFLTFAANEYVRAANLEPKKTDPFLKLVKTDMELRNYNKALSNAQLILQLDPNQLETRFNVVLINIKLSQFDAAEKLLDAYPEMTPPDPNVLYYRGLLNALLGKNDDAQKLLKQAQTATKDPILTDKITAMLDAYQEFNFTQGAEPVYLSELVARGFNKVGEYEMAISLLKETLRQRGDLRDGWILLGFAYLNLENYEFALTAFQKAYSLDSSWPTTLYFLGISHKELGHTADAISFFNLALNNGFEPKLVIYRHLADLYFDSKDYKDSANAYEKVLEISKDDVNSFVRPVWLYLNFLNDPDKALKLAQSAALAFPDAAMSYNLLGWSYTGLKDYAKAEEYLKKAIGLDPNLAAAYYNLGNLYAAQSDQQKALPAYQKAYGLDSNGSIGNLAAQAYNDLLKKSLTK